VKTLKKFLIALFVTMLLVAGCAKDGPTNTSTPNKNETHTCQVPTVEITKVTAPKYFVPDAITPDGSLFGMSGSNLTLWNPKTDKLKIIARPGLESYPQPPLS